MLLLYVLRMDGAWKVAPCISWIPYRRASSMFSSLCLLQIYTVRLGTPKVHVLKVGGIRHLQNQKRDVEGFPVSLQFRIHWSGIYKVLRNSRLARSFFTCYWIYLGLSSSSTRNAQRWVLARSFATQWGLVLLRHMDAFTGRLKKHPWRFRALRSK